MLYITKHDYNVSADATTILIIHNYLDFIVQMQSNEVILSKKMYNPDYFCLEHDFLILLRQKRRDFFLALLRMQRERLRIKISFRKNVLRSHVAIVLSRRKIFTGENRSISVTELDGKT